ncbi:hypothetical protein DFH06DRAFT_1136236 [Mycena polygramma]|nr:hypothetical protein DFH06DRAFT_1136236 [Mycena polygramma]
MLKYILASQAVCDITRRKFTSPHTRVREREPDVLAGCRRHKKYKNRTKVSPSVNNKNRFYVKPSSIRRLNVSWSTLARTRKRRPGKSLSRFKYNKKIPCVILNGQALDNQAPARIREIVEK